MARASTQRKAVPAPRPKAGASRAARPPARVPTDRDREARALDVAARRVPVWQVSTVTVLRRLYDARPAEMGDLGPYKAMKAALGQVPPEVMRAAELNMRGQWPS